MAVVYRAADANRGEQLALKQLTQRASSRDRDARVQFQREFYVLSQLSHPHVIAVRDFGEDAAGPYYTMELLDSGDLSEGAPWPFDQVCQWMVQICSALSLLHSRRLVHRDISPRNVRCTAQGAAKLLDFGAMASMGPCAQIVGTPGFVAPEVVYRLGMDARTDLFSLGATLYYALTGCRPFPARTLAELADAWRNEPVPPGQFVVGIPAALDALVLSLLQIDPALRPGSAFEVMQRLAAILGKPLAESADISRAYLSTPLLVGRQAEQRRFMHSLSRAMHGSEGGGLLIQGASGLGRSRLLDACVLEAKISGATVLRWSGRGASPEAFTAAHRLAQQLLEALPQAAPIAAQQSSVSHMLFEPRAAEPGAPSIDSHHLRSIVSMRDDAFGVKSALLAWLQCVSRTQALMIAVDDVDQIDEASLALLVALVHGASNTRMLVVSTTHASPEAEARSTLAVLSSHCIGMTLAPFSAQETDALFASVFHDAPHASLVSDRIHKLALGNPRDALALAQHMLDRGIIRYDGHWILPPELALGELPENAAEALRIRIAGLPELAKRLAEAQALTLDGMWTRADYQLFAKNVGAESVDAALAVLLRQGIVMSDRGVHTLSHLGVRACLRSQLTAAERVQHERSLAELCAQTGRPGLVVVYHLLHAECGDDALERLAHMVDGSATARSLREQSGVPRRTLALLIERAVALCAVHGRKQRETHELVRLLLELSVTTDNQLYYRHAPAWRTQLERDAGLWDYRELAADSEPTARLQRAIGQTIARYDSTPEAQRVYRVEEAIKGLVQYVNFSMVIGRRTLDTRLLVSLPGLLEPFSVLSPLLHALWQTAIATWEFTCTGRFEQARRRFLDVYQRLQALSERDLPHLNETRHAIAHATASLEIMLGYPDAERWISVMDEDPLLRVSAQYMRRALCLFDGDLAAAERCRKQAEGLALQASTRQMFEPLQFELHVQMHAGDMAGVKHAADRIAELAVQWPGWKAQHELAQGAFQRLRGDLPAALAAFARAMALADPDRHDPPPLLEAWVAAATAHVTVLAELGQYEQAHAFGLRLCERCEALDISTGGYAHVRALALVEARLGEHDRAAARLDHLIAQRAHLRPSSVALDLHARARVALLADDTQAAARFMQLAADSGEVVGGAARSQSKRAQALEAAQQATLSRALRTDPQALAAVGGKTSLAPISAAHPELLASIERLVDAAARAQRVIALLAKAAGARAGSLYYARRAGLLRAADLMNAPDSALDAFASAYVCEWYEYAAMTTVFTVEGDSSQPTAASWIAPNGTAYRIALLHPANGGSCVGLVALCDAPGVTFDLEYRALATAIGAQIQRLGDAEPFGGR
jgi:hypothetical protein